MPNTVKGTAFASNTTFRAQEFVTIVAATITTNECETVAVDDDNVAFAAAMLMIEITDVWCFWQWHHNDANNDNIDDGVCDAC